MTADPYRGYNFKLNINGVTHGHFTECRGLGVRIDSITYREAGNTQVVRHVPGSMDYAPITLGYGLSTSAELREWLMAAEQGNIERKNVEIVLLDSMDSEIIRWCLRDAWPSEWQGFWSNATDRELAIESMTLVFDSFNRDA